MKYPSINILDTIYFGKNQGGSNSFILGDNACILTDDGYISANSIYSRNDITAVGYVQGQEFLNVSLATTKKNIKKYNNSAIEEIKKTDIYTYNYKTDTKGTKKRIGAVIGENYNISEEIIGTTKEAIDTYAMVSLAWKAIQEQQEIIEKQDKQIEELTKRIETLEKGADK